MLTFCVDWDGTCVENVYPEQGDWLPGAVEALYWMHARGTVIIQSVRTAPVMPAPGQPFGAVVDFVEYDATEEVAYIRKMLDNVGLTDVEIWLRPYKPPATFYIDDKGIRFEGEWYSTLAQMEGLLRLAEKR